MEILLNGIWKFKVDEKNDGLNEKWWDYNWVMNNYEKLESISIPNNWNYIKGLENYEGIIWFFYKLPKISQEYLTKDIYIEFKAVNYYSIVWLDSCQLGENKGGFLPFQLFINSGLLLGDIEHYIVVRVDNIRRKDQIPSIIYDWYNWGGIFRDVILKFYEKLRINWVGVKSKLLNNNQANIVVMYEIKDSREDIKDKDFKMKLNWNIFYIGNYSSEKSKRQLNKKELSKSGNDINNKNYAEFNDNLSKENLQNNYENNIEKKDIIDDLLREDFSNQDVQNLIKNQEEMEQSINWVLIKSGEIEVDNNNLKGNFSCIIDQPKLWSIHNPELYIIELYLIGTPLKKRIRFGIRDISIKDNKLLLNNESIKIKGISLHEELLPYGRTIPYDKRKEDILNIKKLGFNSIRTAHYPHDESFYEICDEEGVLIYEEIPVYWNILFKNRDSFKLACKMLRTMILRDYNHPSIILWSCGNEIPINGNIDCLKFMSKLTSYARKLDDSRLISWVSLPSFTKIPRSIRKNTDIYNLNIYLGWYYLSVKNLSFFLDIIHNMNKKKPLVISEFGADAKYGFHTKFGNPKKFSEEYQASLISYYIKILNSKDYITGFFIWIYRDFKSPLRLNKYQQGFNRKGIISEKNEQKLIAKLLPHIINNKIQLKKVKLHNIISNIVGVIFWPFFKIINIIIYKINLMIEILQNKSKFYSNTKK